MFDWSYSEIAGMGAGMIGSLAPLLQFAASVWAAALVLRLVLGVLGIKRQKVESSEGKS